MSSLPPPPPPPPSASSAQATCYRHPNRQAFRQCTRCARPTCDECLTPGSIGSLCPECIKSSRPPTETRVRQWSATRGMLLVTIGLIVINVAVYVWVLTTPKDRFGYYKGEVDLALNRQFIDYGEWWRTITSGFLHFSPFHILSNMLLLFVLGRILEPWVSKISFLSLYMASLLAGSAGVILLESQFTLTGGASGAVFGLLGATAIALHHRGIPVWRTDIGGLLLFNILATFAIDGISIGGHLGGLVGGAICGYFLFAPVKRFPKWVVYVVPAVVAVASFVICLTVSQGSWPPA